MLTEVESLILLNSIPGLGNIRLRRLLEQFDSGEKVLSVSEKDLVFQGRVPLAVAEEIRKARSTDQLRQELELVKKHRVEVLTILDTGYPALLKETVDAPVLLYIRGRIPEGNLSVAMVGSRRASIYGMSMAEKFSVQLAEYGITIVSGLAKGIDTASHRGVLKAKGKTVAVLGSGLANIYPRENEALAEAIAQNGAVISEFPMAMAPLTHNFPRRNRIISGLSLGVVVVEASSKSGALITARFAGEQGREVFAIPGKIDQPNAAGSHKLIKDGAKLVTGVEDILEELKPQLEHIIRAESELKEPPQEPSQEIFLNSFEKQLYECITNEPQHVDTLLSLTDKSLSDLTMLLLQLEIKGLVQQLPGHFFKRRIKELYV